MVTKYEVEKVIVLRPGVAVPSAGTRLFDTTTGAINLAVGGGAFFENVAGSSNPKVVNSASYSGPVKFIMRRDTSNDPSVLAPRLFESSEFIDIKCMQGIEFGGETYAAPSVSSWLVGVPESETNVLAPAANTLYKLQASSHGWRTDMFNSVYNTPTIWGRTTTPNWSATTYTTASKQLDYTIQALVEDFNQQSASSKMNKFAVAVAIDSQGTDGLDFDSFTVGDIITIGYDRMCNPVNLTITAERLTAFEALTAKLLADYSITAGTATLVPYVLPTNCAAVPSGEAGYAGTDATKADMVFMLAMDEALAAYDEVPETRVRLNASLYDEASATIAATPATPVTAPSEGEGQARNLRIMYDNNEHYNSYSSSRRWGANFVAYPDEILANEAYTMYNVQHCANRIATSGMPSFSPLNTTIAVVYTNRTSGTTPYSTGSTNPQATHIQAVLSALATAAGKIPVTLV